jgi:predicted phosphate transport protein (TIGR00153 family)
MSLPDLPGNPCSSDTCPIKTFRNNAFSAQVFRGQMSLTTFFKFLSPKDTTFFPLFKQDTDNLIVMGNVLYDLVTEPKDKVRSKLTEEIDRLENVGDDITHEIYVALEKTFITPFDREDVHALAAALDDIADYIQGSAARVRLYHIASIPTPVVDMTKILQEGIVEISKSVALLMDLKKHKEINESLVKIHSLENAADRIFNSAIEQLFLKEKNAIKLIKMKELLAMVETATDRCEDVANVIESIVIKYS